MKKILRVLVIATVLSLGILKVAQANTFVNLTVKNNGVVVYAGALPLSPTPSEDNVLSVIKQADSLSSDFDISNIIHYSFGDYLKCINVSGNELCDNWQYKVNGDSPMVGMDSEILLGGENVVIYFGSDNAPVYVVSAGGPLITNPPPYPELPILQETSDTQDTPPVSNNPTPSFDSPILSVPVINPIETETKNPKTKTVVLSSKKIVKKITQNTAGQNKATVINALEKQSPEPVKKGWFRNLLDKIFSIF